MFKAFLSHPLARVALVTTLVGGLTACGSSTDANGNGIVYGPAQTLAGAQVRTYATIDHLGRATSVGVAIPESAMASLPTENMPGMPMGAMLSLDLPAPAMAAGYDHVSMHWNPLGHEPDGIYTQPHFDFHFFTATRAVEAAIMPTDPQFEQKAALAPPAQYQPAGFIQFPGAVPGMGAHWGDPTSPELLPPPNTQLFTRTFLYGSYDGQMIFFEPMITRTAIEAVKGLPPATMAIGVPAAYQKPGRYPTSYTIAYDAETKEYRVALDGLVARQ